jgi:hypothetical protein
MSDSCELRYARYTTESRTSSTTESELIIFLLINSSDFKNINPSINSFSILSFSMTYNKHYARTGEGRIMLVVVQVEPIDSEFHPLETTGPKCGLKLYRRAAQRVDRQSDDNLQSHPYDVQGTFTELEGLLLFSQGLKVM